MCRKTPQNKRVEYVKVADLKTPPPETEPLYYDSITLDPYVAIVMDQCKYCGQWSEEFYVCPHCGAPFLG